MESRKPKRGVYVSDAKEQRSPEQLRKVGRALIAMARAQLEAEAEAAHKLKTEPRKSA